MINHLDLKDFLTFEELSIPRIRRINLIAGKNNSGKTALLQALRIYISGGDSTVVNNVLEDRGVFLPGRIDSYKALFNSSSIAKQVKDNYISCSISEVEIRGEKNKKKNGNGFREFRVYTPGTMQEDHDADLNLLTPISADYPNDFGIYIPFHGSYTTLKDLWEKVVLTPKEEKVISILREAIEPRLLRLDVGSDKVRVRLDDSLEPVPIQLLGDGVQRILLIALGLANAEGKFLLIDEIELGLHHSVMEKVWKIIFDYSQEWDIQVFATTHSQDVIKNFYYVASKEENLDYAEFIRLQIGRNGKHETIIYDGDRLKDSLELSLEIR